MFTEDFENGVNALRVERRRLELLFEKNYISGLLSLIIALIITELADQLYWGSSMSFWILIQAFIVGCRISYVQLVYRQWANGKEQYRLNNTIFSLIILVGGISWGLFIYLYMPGLENIELMIAIITIMTGMTAANMVGLAASIESSYSFIFTAMLGLGIRLYELNYYADIYSLIIFTIFLAILTHRLNKAVLHSINLDLTNEMLVKQVTIEKNIAEQSNIEKSHFLAAASHDLRQPLNSLALFHYALRESLKNINEEKPLMILNRAEQSYNSIKDLFDSLLEISSLDAGTVKAENKYIKLQFIIQPLIDEMSEVASAKNLELHYQPSQCNVETDPILLSRILRNLIGNAIKYSHEGTIDVIEELTENSVHIKVKDMGIGIPKTEYNNIFNEYHQLANKKRDRRQGIGLGLSIVKKICSVIDADISLTSKINVGSTFTVTLTTAESLNDITDITDITDFEAIDLSGKKALILDDEPDILIAMKLLFNIWQMDVKTAENYIQGQEIMKNFQPDIIICDYKIQNNMNGVEVIEGLRRKYGKEIPAIIITGDTAPSLLKLINSQGFDMLSKPIQPGVLHHEIGLRLK